MFASSNNPKVSPTKKGNEFKSKKYFKDNKLTGLFQDFDPYTGKLKQQGRFQNGVEVGKWKQIDDDGDEIHYSYTLQRVGAICGDGTRSYATGRGACSWHGGVAEWLYDSVRSKVGGTGKHSPIEQRVQDLKKEVKTKLKITKQGLEFEQAVFNILLDLLDEKEELMTQVSELEESLLAQVEAKKQIQDELEELKQIHNKCLQADKEDKEKQKEPAKDYKEKQSKQVSEVSFSPKKSPQTKDKVTDNLINKTQPNIANKEKAGDNANQKDSKETKKTENPFLFEQKAPKQVQVKVEKKKKVESDESDEWQSVQDEREKGQNALIRELFQKMNLK